MKITKDGVSISTKLKGLTKVAIKKDIIEDYGPMQDVRTGRGFGKKSSFGHAKVLGSKRQSITNSTATHKDQVVGGGAVSSSQRSSSYNQHVPNSTQYGVGKSNTYSNQSSQRGVVMLQNEQSIDGEAVGRKGTQQSSRSTVQNSNRHTIENAANTIKASEPPISNVSKVLQPPQIESASRGVMSPGVSSGRSKSNRVRINPQTGQPMHFQDGSGGGSVVLPRVDAFSGYQGADAGSSFSKRKKSTNLPSTINPVAQNIIQGNAVKNQNRYPVENYIDRH